MTEVVTLQTVTRPTLPVSEELVERLEGMLALAREGKIQGMAWVSVRTSGVGHYETVGTGWGGHSGGYHVLLGGCAVLQSRLLAASAEGEVEVEA